MKKLRIAVLAPTFLPKCSGAEVFHHNLASRLAESGHHVTVFAPRAAVRQLRAQGWSLPYNVEAYPDKRWNWLKRNRRFAFWLNRRALSALQRKHRFDLWHAFVLHPAGVVLADWQRHSGIPGLVRAVGDDVSGLPSREHEPRIREDLCGKLPSAGALVALSDEMADELEQLGIPRAKIRIIPNAVDAERFAASPETRTSARRELDVPDDAFVFLCVARNHPQKDFPTLFAAFRTLRSALPERDLRLVIAGRNARSMEAELGDLAGCVCLREFGADNTARSIPLMPPQKLVDLYLASDAFVLSSLLEGFSSAIIEATAAGLPLVVTDAPGIRGVVTDGREGLLVPVRSPGALAAAMQEVVEDAGLRARLSASARQTAARYTWPVVVDAYVSLYGELIDSRAR